MRKGILLTLISLTVLIAAAFAVLMLYSPVPDQSSFGVTLDDLPSAAAVSKGSGPDHINVLSMAEGTFPPGFVGAGNFRSQRVPYFTYQIVYAKSSQAPVIVDTGMARAYLTGISKGVIFSDTAFNALQNAMRKASLIVLTHEHFDHVGGLAQSPYFDEIAPKTVMTSEQKESRWIKDDRFAPGALEKTRTLSYQKLYPLSPGIVLIKTPGHTSGHQVVYVRLSDGKEIILAGDIGWSLANITIPRGRPLLVSLLLGEDRASSADQLRWLSDMKKAGVTLLVSHDLEQTQEEEKKGTIHEGME